MKILLLGPSENYNGGQATHIKNLLGIGPSLGIRYSPINTMLSGSTLGAKLKLLIYIKVLLEFGKLLLGSNIIHLNSSFENRSLIRDLPFLFLSVMFRKKVVLQFHGGEPNDTSFFLRKIIKLLILSKVKVFVLTQLQYEQLKFIDITSSKVTNYLYCNVKQNNVRRNLVVNFLFLGRLTEIKGISKLLSVSKELSEEGKLHKLHICGKGDAEADVYEAKRINPAIIYHGLVQGNQKELILEQCDVNVLASEHKEGIPYSLLESMVHSNALIVSNAGEMSSLVDNNGSILIQNTAEELKESMLKYIENPTLLKEHQTKSLSTFENKHSSKVFGIFLKKIYGISFD